MRAVFHSSVFPENRLCALLLGGAGAAPSDVIHGNLTAFTQRSCCQPQLPPLLPIIVRAIGVPEPFREAVMEMTPLLGFGCWLF